MSTTASSSVAAGSLASVHGPCVMSLYTHFAMHRSCMSRTLELQPSGRAASLMSVARMSRSAAMSRTVMSSVRLFFTTRYRMSSESGSGIDERAAPRSKCSNRPNVRTYVNVSAQGAASGCKLLPHGLTVFRNYEGGASQPVPLPVSIRLYRYAPCPDRAQSSALREAASGFSRCTPARETSAAASVPAEALRSLPMPPARASALASRRLTVRRRRSRRRRSR